MGHLQSLSLNSSRSWVKFSTSSICHSRERTGLWGNKDDYRNPNVCFTYMFISSTRLMNFLFKQYRVMECLNNYNNNCFSFDHENGHCAIF